MPITDDQRANYKIHLANDPTKTDVSGKLTTLPVGTRLTDCFGISYVIPNPNDPPCRHKFPQPERGGPQFI